MKYDWKVKLIVHAAFTVLVILVCIFMWRTERWFNWKYMYATRVDQQITERISMLERHIKVVEARLTNIDARVTQHTCEECSNAMNHSSNNSSSNRQHLSSQTK